MYNKIEIVNFILVSFIGALGINIYGDAPFIYYLVGVLVANIILQSAYKYTISSNRPITFTLMFMMYICLAGYSKDYASKYINADTVVKILEYSSTSSILFISCITVVFININSLKQVIKEHAYLWFPANYVFIFVVFVVISISEWVPVQVKRVNYFIAMIGVIVLCFCRNEIKSREEIDYDIPFKSYLGYSLMAFTIILVGTMVLPKPEYLPGAKFIQNMNGGGTGDVRSSTKLNRNPSTSEEMLFKVYAEEPLHLRSIAYSNYEDGVWSIQIDEKETEPLIDNDFFDEFDILYSRGEVERKTAYIMEFGEYKNYLTVNGIKRISPDNYISIVGDINNICFKEDNYEESIAYTIEYYDKEDNFEEQKEINKYSMSRETWLSYLRSRNLMGTTYLLSDNEYKELVDKYTQIPKELSESFTKLALKITTGSAGQIQEAKKIEEYLKFEGGYKYEIGAKKKQKLADSVYDFLFNGKKGICQDFASGMTLLCRSIGIPARYVTGYYSDEMNDDKDYIVRSKHAHAFVEVYICGYGWMLFDPTPPGSVGVNVGITSGTEYGEKSNIIQLEERTQSLFTTSFSSALAMIIALIIMIWISKIVSGMLWRKRLLQESTTEAIVEIYASLVQIIRDNGIEIKDTQNTTQITKDMLKIGINIGDITKPFEDYYYGNKIVTQIDIEKAIKRHQEIKKSRTWKSINKKATD